MFVQRLSSLLFFVPTLTFLGSFFVPSTIQAKGSSAHCCGGCRSGGSSARTSVVRSSAPRVGGHHFMPHYFSSHHGQQNTKLPDSFWPILWGAVVFLVSHLLRRLKKILWLKNECSCSVWCCKELTKWDILFFVCVFGAVYYMFSFLGVVGACIGMMALWFRYYVHSYPTGA